MRAAKWIEVPREALAGSGLRPYQPGEIAVLFDWIENPRAGSVHLMPQRGRFIVDIVGIETNTVHQPSKPGDELVVVLNGTLTLTTDAAEARDRRTDVFARGEMVLIPAGWAGLYAVDAAEGDFLELALVPGDYFDEGIAPPPSGALPRRLELPATPGRHEIFRGRYGLEADNRAEASEWVLTGAEEVVQVLAGTLSLTADDYSASFGPGSIVILPEGLAGKAKATADYRALAARWID